MPFSLGDLYFAQLIIFIIIAIIIIIIEKTL